MWLASVPEARTASGLTLLFANITTMDTATRGKAANTCTVSAVKPPGSPQKNEVDPWKGPLKGRRLQRKAKLEDLKRIKAKIRIKGQERGLGTYVTHLLHAAGDGWRTGDGYCAFWS